MKFNAAFWKWFGNSQVVDAHGDPLVAYHGTISPDAFYKFEARKKNYAWSDAVLGFFFTGSARIAEDFNEDGATMAVYLKIENPMIIPGLAFYNMITSGMRERDFRQYRRDVIRDGHDGIIVEANKGIDKLYGPGWRQFNNDLFIVFKPTQIKSATGNDGTWNASDPDIRSNPRRHR